MGWDGQELGLGARGVAGTYLAMPAAAAQYVGLFYYATDLAATYVCVATGAGTYAWQAIAPSGSLEYELTGFVHAVNYLASPVETTSLGLVGAGPGTLIVITRAISYGGGLVAGGVGEVLVSKCSAAVAGNYFFQGDNSFSLGTDNKRVIYEYGGLATAHNSDDANMIAREMGDVLVYEFIFSGATSYVTLNGRELLLTTVGAWAEPAATRFAIGDIPDGDNSATNPGAMTNSSFIGLYVHPTYTFTRADRTNFYRNVKQTGPGAALLTERNNRANSACLRAADFDGSKISWNKNGTPGGSALLSDQTMTGTLTLSSFIAAIGKEA